MSAPTSEPEELLVPPDLDQLYPLALVAEMSICLQGITRRTRMYLCVCVCFTSVCAGLVDNLFEDTKQQIEDSREDGNTACKITDDYLT